MLVWIGEYSIIGFETVLLEHGGIAESVVSVRASNSKTESRLCLPFALNIYGGILVRSLCRQEAISYLGEGSRDIEAGTPWKRPY